MEHDILLIGLALSLFASTNVDDVFVLLGFLSDPRFTFRQVALGQYLGIATLYGASVVASLIALVVSPAYVGLLGLVPIYMGVKSVWELRKGEDVSEEHAPSAGYGNVIAVASVTIANGGDNLSIYTPLFASRSGFDIIIIGVVFAMMTLVWIIAAHRLANHRIFAVPIQRYGHRIVPFVFIALGLFILHEAGSFALLRR